MAPLCVALMALLCAASMASVASMVDDSTARSFDGTALCSFDALLRIALMLCCVLRVAYGFDAPEFQFPEFAWWVWVDGCA
jgi:hypothetical protein